MKKKKLHNSSNLRQKDKHIYKEKRGSSSKREAECSRDITSSFGNLFASENYLAVKAMWFTTVP